MSTHSEPFWTRKSLGEMTPSEWESLCDGCGRCCAHKIEDEETGTVEYTRVACRLLDLQSCRCRHYEQRHRLVPECAHLGPLTMDILHWMPETCAYRLLAEGGRLPEWHPLLTGDPESVVRAGVSARGALVPEEEAGELEEYLF